MSDLFELIAHIVSDLNWRYGVCIALALILSIIAHMHISGEFWDWFVSIPLMIFSLIIASKWHVRSKRL